MGQNSDVLRRGYDAFAQGDVEGALENFADDIEWEGTNFERLPGAGTHHGKDGVAQLFQRTFEAFDGFRVEPDEFIEGDETVIVLGHTEGSARETGNSFKVPFVHVWRMQDGKVKRVQVLTDTAVVAEAMGLT